MKQYSAINRSELLINVTTLTNPKSRHKEYTVWFHLYDVLEYAELTSGDRSMVASGVGTEIEWEGALENILEC